MSHTALIVIVIPPAQRLRQLGMHSLFTERQHNPRPAGVWLVTRPAGGGGRGAKGPLRSPKLLGRFPNFKRHSIPLYVNYPYKVKKVDLEVTDDVTGQVKVRIFDFSGLVTSASKISMLSANKANESAWIVSLTSVSIVSCALWP